MFCYQCEQTARGEGCGKSGVCGKAAGRGRPAGSAGLRPDGDGAGRRRGAKRPASATARRMSLSARPFFATVTNVDFDPERLAPLIRRAAALRDALLGKLRAAGVAADFPDAAVKFSPANDLPGLVAQGEAHGIRSYPAADADILSLKHTLLYGIKGLAAYADHALILGQEDEAIFAFLHEALAALLRREAGSGRGAGARHEMRPGEPPGDGAPGCGQHRGLRPSDAHKGAARGEEGEGDSCLRARPEGSRRAAETDRGEGDQRLYPRRDAARPRLSGAQEIRPSFTVTTGRPGRTRRRSSPPSPGRS